MNVRERLGGAHTQYLHVFEEAREKVGAMWARLAEIEYENQSRVLRAFKEAGVGSHDLQGSTGYGYGDESRVKLERVFAAAFGAESALVRPQIASGTHALWICLDALLHAGDELISVTGAPYDTLRAAIAGDSPQALVQKGVAYREVALAPSGGIDLEAIARAWTPRTKLLFVQRSKGYAWRPALRVAEIERLCRWRDEHAPRTPILVDNCYGEFVEAREPCSAGADLAAGSLIKNPGGTLAPGGGYVVGRESLVAAVAERMTAPGLGRGVGPSYGVTPILMQGIFVAPHFVAQALAGTVLGAYVFERLGLEVLPRWNEEPGDTVLAVKLGDPERLIAFCQAVQESSPVDSFVRLEPGPLPGYSDPVVMAAGTFVQGASSELSADAPLREPYAAFLQGGTSRAHLEIALRHICETLRLSPS